jgi:hypothetical protein
MVFFLAVTAGWRINNEEFLKNVAVSNLKLRAGYEVGNQSIGDNARFGLYEADTVLIKMYIIRFFNIYYNVNCL